MPPRGGKRVEASGGRTMVKQVTKKVEAATSPFQYALSTRSGCECVAHVLQKTKMRQLCQWMELGVSKKAMLDGLLSLVGRTTSPFRQEFREKERT